MQYQVLADTLTGIKGRQLKAGDIINADELENNIDELVRQSFIKEIKPEVKTKSGKDAI